MSTLSGSVPLLTVFSHLNAEKAALYRAVLAVFLEAKATFVLHLRPLEVCQALGETRGEEQGELDAALTQLCHWGNLEAHQDHSEVTTAEEFYRPRFLYQLTAAGEAAEQAIALFHQVLEQPGELQTTALLEIRQHLHQLAALVREEPLDEGRVSLSLRALTDRFEELTRRAQMFLRTLQQRIDPQHANLEKFLSYKGSLIDYLERFIGELVIATHEVAGRLQEIEAHGVDRLLEAAAAREVADALEHERAERLTAARAFWHARWNGLRGWFIGTPATVGEVARASQAEMLRARARSAIPALLAAVARINDRRAARSDRVADLQTLARWFAQAPDDEAAHRLWRTAFALTPARHLKIDADTLDARETSPVPAQTSWLEAEPIPFSPRIRKTGRHVPKGAARKTVDRTREKALLARLAQEEAFQVEEAQRRLATGRRMRLSELGVLEQPAEFDLFLDLLGEALAGQTAPSQTVTATSSDGALNVVLEPASDGAVVRLQTSDGCFIGKDHYVTITPSL